MQADLPKPRRFLPRYDVGVTPLYAAACDQRVGWRLCVPRSYAPDAAMRHRLAIFVHGTWREDYAWLVQPWCDRTGLVALAPLFPAGITVARELDNYKFLAFDDMRFDRLLLAIIDEIAAHWRIDADDFLLFGFSGGAQFAHRFALLHPRRVRALAIAAAGSVTLPVDPRPFWVGTGDLTRRFGTALDTRALSCIAIRAFVGDADIETDEIHVQPHHADWMEGANDSGRTRIDRGRALVDAFRGCGADAQLILVPSCGHDHRALLPHALAFFDSILVG